MKRLFSFGKKKKRGLSPSASDSGSVLSAGYELKEKELGKLHRAAAAGDLAKLRQLLKKHDVNLLDKENRTPLHLACANGHPELVTFLVENKSRVNVCDNDSRSPLMKAVQCQQERCVTLLLEHEADPNVVDINGNTALHLAALIPALSVASQLLEHDARIDARNKENCTPLILAVAENHQDIAEYLLKEGADVNAKDKSGRTSLMVAASNGQISLVKLLLQCNANLSIKDDKGWTADDYAIMNGHHACSHLIIEHGSKKKLNHSPLYYGTSKAKPMPLFSSPGKVIDIGFTLGGPAVDKEVADDNSQAESASRASDKVEGGDSWASSEEEELAFTPKKSQKPSLTHIMSAPQQTKKTVNEQISIIRNLPIAISQQSKSDSEDNSVPDSEDEDMNNHSPPKPLGQAQSSLHPVYMSPISLLRPPQMTSTPLLGFEQEEESSEKEDSSDLEKDDNDKYVHNVSIQETGLNSAGILPTLDAPENLETSAFKRGTAVLMSELGLEEDPNSVWDSESASESPIKQAESDLTLPAIQTQVQNSSEDPSKGSSEKCALLQTAMIPAVSEIHDASPKEGLAKENMGKQKSDLMEEFGLDDADDIEDVSDWDSTNSSLKYIPHARNLQISPDKKCSPVSPLSKTNKENAVVVEAEDETIPVMPLEENCIFNVQTSVEPMLQNNVQSLEAPKPELEYKQLMQLAQKNEEKSSWESGDNLCVPNLEENEKLKNVVVLPPASMYSGPLFKMELSEEQSLENGETENSHKEIDEEKRKNTQDGQQYDEMKTLPLRGNHETATMQKMMVGDKKKLHLKGNQSTEKGGKKNTLAKKQVKNSISTKGQAKSLHKFLKRNNLPSVWEDGSKNQSKKWISKLTPKSNDQPVMSANGNPLEVFDDSTASETSLDDGRFASKAVTNKDKVNLQVDIIDDLDDLTPSSDTATEECDSPTSTVYKNALLLIAQLGIEGQDSVSLLKIQNIVHEYERLIEKENGRYVLLMGKLRKLENDKKEFQQIIEETRESKSKLEHEKVELESDLNNLRFTLKQEEEKRKSSELLYEKGKDQLRKKEDQCCKEMEEKQQLELTLRNLEMEQRAMRNNMKQLEEERNEAQRLLSQERSARVQEGILNNHLRKQKEIEETKKIAKSSEMSEVSEREKDLVRENRLLEEEMTVLRLELKQVRARNQEEESKYSEEKEILKEKIDDVKKNLKLNEESLTQTILQYNGQINALKTETSMLSSKVEHEKQSKERLEAEVESFRSRLSTAVQELERSQASKSDAEHTLQRERDKWLHCEDKLNDKLSSLQETINNLSQQLSKAEAKANSLENELHCTTLTVREKTQTLETTQVDLNQAQIRTKELEKTLETERSQKIKCTVKQETTQERLAQIQSENMLLRQQLEDVQNKGLMKEKAVSDVQDRFSDIYSKLRADSERQIYEFKERNKELISNSNEFREQVYKLETEKVEREGALRQLQQEIADSLKKLSMSEASLEVTTRYRNDLEDEKLHLQKEIEKIKSKLQDSEEKHIQAEHHVHELKNAFDVKERELLSASQKLQEFSAVSSETEKTVKQLEEHIQRLEIENARLEATVQQQTSKIEILQKERQESTLVCNRFEDLITSLQAAKIGLEDQLNQQVHKQTVLSQSAQDSHNLWEEELKSRSRLGIRLTQLDREKTELVDQFEGERKKVKKLAELKRSLEARLDQEIKRNGELQKETNGLKKLLKNAKKKMKEYESGEFVSQRNTFQSDLKNKHFETESQISRLKTKVDELSQRLETESSKSAQLESSNCDLQEQLSSMNILHKNHEKSKHQLEEEVANLKRHVETNMMDHNQMDQYRKEIEQRARQEIRQKLEEVNLFLQTQAASQEALEQIKANNDATLRNQLEHRIQDLESELGRVKSAQQDSLSQKESSQTELGRYRDLYSEELKLRKSLANKLDRANERLSEANSKLLNEHQRSKTFANNIVNRSLTASPVLDASQFGNLGNNLTLNRNLGLGGGGGGFLSSVGNALSSTNRVEAYLAKMQVELEKNITKELDQANAELESGSVRVSPVGSTTGSLRNLTVDQDPVSRATQQYVEVLKKNYKI
ncbi:ankyrin repeat domain-containing protein 26 [Microcaecilia unicolor]|uniref:Ankyrin repeat domain-containing protein 26 n=1 Tax=Microcaecilia unicolor TaxID=1415580 RepID=A0A6P7Z3R7_9AMPH|nr:ankyrin repeat domain-containing protein 26 [Microcaecilia unicolor]